MHTGLLYFESEQVALILLCSGNVSCHQIVEDLCNCFVILIKKKYVQLTVELNSWFVTLVVHLGVQCIIQVQHLAMGAK